MKYIPPVRKKFIPLFPRHAELPSAIAIPAPAHRLVVWDHWQLVPCPARCLGLLLCNCAAISQYVGLKGGHPCSCPTKLPCGAIALLDVRLFVSTLLHMPSADTASMGGYWLLLVHFDHPLACRLCSCATCPLRKSQPLGTSAVAVCPRRLRGR